MSFVVLDVGGTFIKAALVTNSGRYQVLRSQVPGFLRSSGRGGHGRSCEIDGPTLMAHIRNLLSQLDPANTLPVLLAGQMAGLAFVDDEGNALEPLISWQDRRYRGVAQVTKKLTERTYVNSGERARVGTPLITLSEHKIPARAWVTSLIGYVAGQLEGARAQQIHVTDAASWGMVDLSTWDWSDEILDSVGLSRGRLPSVCSRVETDSNSSRVRIGVGDQQASLLGAGLQIGWVSVNIATGCQVSVLDDRVSETTQTRPYFQDLFPNARYLHTKTHLTAGRYLRDMLYNETGGYNWDWFQSAPQSKVETIFGPIVEGVCEAIREMRVQGRPILFSGGVAQKFEQIRDAIVAKSQSEESRVYVGDDATLAGLIKLGPPSHSLT